MGPSNGFVLHHGPTTNPALSVLPSSNVNVMFPWRYEEDPEAGQTAVARAWKDWNV